MPFTNQSGEEIASLHGEPDWLRARRRAAWNVYERIGLPNRSDKEWRRVDFKGFDFEHFKAFESANGGPPGLPIKGAAGGLRQRGSEPGRVEVDEELTRKGVVFMPPARPRGIPRVAAQRMIVQGFFGEVVDRIPFEQARKLVEEELEARLG